MKIVVSLLSLMLVEFSLQSLQVSALPANPTTSKIKIGTIDMQKLISTVSETKTISEQLQKDAKAKEAQILKQNEELDKADKLFQSRKAMLSPEAKRKEKEELRKKIIALEQSRMAFGKEFSDKQIQETNKITTKAANILEDLAKKEEVDVVFETNSGRILYIKNPIDFTETTIATYDKNNIKNAPQALQQRSK